MPVAPDHSPVDCAVRLPQPRTTEEERALTAEFLRGFRTLFTDGADPEPRRRLLQALRHSATCRRCSGACHVFAGSGREQRYLPGARTDILRRLHFKYVKQGGGVSRWWHGDIELDWNLLVELADLTFRCNLCGRCGRNCDAADHALVVRALRRVFREMGIAPISERRYDPREIRDRIAAIDQETSRRAGIEFQTAWDVENAEVLLVQPASAVAFWPENIGALALVLTCAGVKWTMASELAADDLAYAFAHDGAEALEMVHRCAAAASRLRAHRIVVGESGGACYALLVRGASEFAGLPRESSMTFLRDIVRSRRIEFDPIRNDFAVTLHDPCNLVQCGIVEPQREILRRLCPQFREMDPWAERNFCCGGGGGLAQVEGARDWRVQVAGRMKMEQVLDAFSECLDAETRKYVCAPCGNCKAQFRDLFSEHAPWRKNRILYGGLAELVANAIVCVQPGFLQWEWR